MAWHFDPSRVLLEHYFKCSCASMGVSRLTTTFCTTYESSWWTTLSFCPILLSNVFLVLFFLNSTKQYKFFTYLMKVWRPWTWIVFSTTYKVSGKGWLTWAAKSLDLAGRNNHQNVKYWHLFGTSSILWQYIHSYILISGAFYLRQQSTYRLKMRQKVHTQDVPI